MLLALVTALQDAQAPAAAPGFNLVPIVLIIGVVYFVLIAPERKNRKRRDAMLVSLKKGDKVMTTSGMHGTIAQVNGETVTLQVADNVRLKFTVQAVQSLVEDPPAKAETKQVEAKT